MRLVYLLSTSETPELTLVGGKAMSLILMTQHGLPVPPGFVLTVDFFQPWLDHIKQTPEWAQVLRSAPEELEQNCLAVKALCMQLELDEPRQQALAQALESLRTEDRLPLVAVRSSSPEEDLEELSFAGGYETTLGVKQDGIEEAVRRSFASCFDDRVFLYKREHGLAVGQPRIAVIVQQQIVAETAGVAFSLNPLNNCYDEVVINANYGLGESVVAGMASPDSFIVDKFSRTILERKPGKKETSVWVAPDGGTYQLRSPRHDELCLSDEKVLELADMLIRVESYFQKPIDIEWALASGAFMQKELYLLQARPITAYFPLPEKMLTAPGEQKYLYGDVTLSKWGMHEPLSVMGTDYLQIANAATLRMTMGPDIDPEIVEHTRFATEGRVYANFSHSLRLQGKGKVVALIREMDGLSAEIVASIDEREYVPAKLPPAMKGLLFKMIRQNLGLFWHGLRALSRPAEYKKRFLEEIERLREVLAALTAEQSLPMRAFAERTMNALVGHVRAFMAILLAAQIAKSSMKRVFKNDPSEIRDRLVYLERALPNNITIEMGLAMYQLANSAEIRGCPSGEFFATELQPGLRERAFSGEFLEAWDMFMAQYGFRGPREMDPSAPRFYERPAQFFEQLHTMAEHSDTAHNPQAIFERAKSQREGAYRDLLQAARRKGRRQAKRFEKNYRVFIDLAGYRETPKYYVAMIADMFRKQVLAAARALVQAGRLDTPEQVFDLTIADLDRALADPALDLRALAEENTHFLKRLRHVHELPRIVDSRGKILRAPRKEAEEGELVGEPISPGNARGPVKTLRTPDEKPVLPGEILVARATDPGWTPLFINASGVILEVGGMLQHGALVAREYGKPCVSGIEHALKTLRDGQMVELDGTNGIVRMLK